MDFSFYNNYLFERVPEILKLKDFEEIFPIYIEDLYQLETFSVNDNKNKNLYLSIIYYILTFTILFIIYIFIIIIK